MNKEESEALDRIFIKESLVELLGKIRITS